MRHAVGTTQKKNDSTVNRRDKVMDSIFNFVLVAVSIVFIS